MGAAMNVRLTVVTANIGRGYRTGEVLDNILRVRHGFGTPLVGWQEIDEADQADEHKILGRVFGPNTYDNVGFRQAVPISVPQPWGVVDSSVTKACDFIPKATPNRYVVSALCQHPDLPAPIRFANTHYPLARLGGRLGKSRWKDVHETFSDLVHEWHKAGEVVITTSDSNEPRARKVKLHPREKQLLPNAIVRVSLIPAEARSGIRVTAGKRPVVDLTIDRHSAKGVELTFTPL